MNYTGKLFAAFGLLHASSEYEGSGLGLAIVQRITRLCGGRVWVESSPGEGATCIFTILASEHGDLLSRV